MGDETEDSHNEEFYRISVNTTVVPTICHLLRTNTIHELRHNFFVSWPVDVAGKVVLQDREHNETDARPTIQRFVRPRCRDIAHSVAYQTM